MSNNDTPPNPGRRPGPWDQPAAATPVSDPKVVPLRADDSNRRPASPPFGHIFDRRGQHPVWVLISVVLLGGLIWVLWGSWQVAVAVVFGVFVHEYGHVLAMNAVGMGPARLYIVPFFGGLAAGERPPSSEWHGVLVSLAGPVFGLLAAVPFFVMAYALNQPVWLNGAFAIGVLNLLNLLPAPPLDGSKAIGPVLAKIHPLVEKAAIILVGIAAVIYGVWSGSYFLAVFVAIAIVGYLKNGEWRPGARRLTGGEAVLSILLFLIAVALCFAVAGGALVLNEAAPLAVQGVTVAPEAGRV